MPRFGPNSVGAAQTPNPGRVGQINLQGNVFYAEESLKRPKIDAVKPFNQALSDAEQPIRVVVAPNGDVYVLQGCNRIFGALEDGVKSVNGVILTAAEYRHFYGAGTISGTPNPSVLAK